MFLRRRRRASTLARKHYQCWNACGLKKIHFERDALSETQLSLPTCTHRGVQPSDCGHLAFERCRRLLRTFYLEKHGTEDTRKKQVNSLAPPEAHKVPTNSYETARHERRSLTFSSTQLVKHRTEKILEVWRPTVAQRSTVLTCAALSTREHVPSTPLQTAKFCLCLKTWALRKPAGFRLERGTMAQPPTVRSSALERKPLAHQQLYNHMQRERRKNMCSQLHCALQHSVFT